MLSISKNSLKKLISFAVKAVGFFIKINFCFFCFVQAFASDTKLNYSDDEGCVDYEARNVLVLGWDETSPYKFTYNTFSGTEIIGMDIEILKALSRIVGQEIRFKKMSWAQQLENLSNAGIDIVAGATKRADRAEYAYFSKPYRYEEDSLFLLKSGIDINFKSIEELLTQIRIKNVRIGVVKNNVYANEKINEFIVDRVNADLVEMYDNVAQGLQGLLRKDVEGFLTARLKGASAVINYNVSDKVYEMPLNFKVPIHLMFSKKSISPALVHEFDKAIDEFYQSGEYNDIVRNYLYPVLLLQTVNSGWFYIVGVIGTIAFALSALAIAAKENATLFGTILLALLPAIGGIVLRDIIINHQPVGIFLTPSYIYYSITIVLIGFASLRLLGKYVTESEDENEPDNVFWDSLLLVCDAFGQAAFIVTGVSIVIMARIHPVELWGPFFAFLTANGGNIFRDILRKHHKKYQTIFGELNLEVSVLWGVIFSLFLKFQAKEPDQIQIQYAVITVIIGAFLTRLIVHYFKIPNLKFKTTI